MKDDTRATSVSGRWRSASIAACRLRSRSAPRLVPRPIKTRSAVVIRPYHAHPRGDQAMTIELIPDLVKDLPPSVAMILQEFIATLAASRALESVILFGSAAEGRLRSTSDVILLVIAQDWTLEQLDAARLPLRSGRAAAGLTVMFLKSAEIAAAVASFAVKFADIKARHRVLLGKSPFDALQI